MNITRCNHAAHPTTTAQPAAASVSGWWDGIHAPRADTTVSPKKSRDSYDLLMMTVDVVYRLARTHHMVVFGQPPDLSRPDSNGHTAGMSPETGFDSLVSIRQDSPHARPHTTEAAATLSNPPRTSGSQRLEPERSRGVAGRLPGHVVAVRERPARARRTQDAPL